MAGSPVTLVINSVCQPRFALSRYQCVHLREVMLSETYQQQKMGKSAAITAPSRVAYFTNEGQTIINMYEEFKEMIEAKISPAAASKHSWQEIGDFIISNI